MNTTIAEAYRFFKEHASYVVGRKALGALSLAKAEIEASKRGWDVRWEPELEPVSEFLGDHACWCSSARRAQTAGKESTCEHEAFYAVAVDEEGHTLPHGLGGILDPSRDYSRVVAAELFAEILYNEKECASIMAL